MLDLTNLPQVPFKVKVVTMPQSPTTTVWDSYHAVPEARNIGKLPDGVVVTIKAVKASSKRLEFVEGNLVQRNNVPPVNKNEFWLSSDWVELYNPVVVVEPGDDNALKLALAAKLEEMAALLRASIT